MFSDRLRSARKRNNLTQEGLAKKVNTKKTTISNYETGYSTPSHEMLNDLADVLQVSTDYLLGRTDDPKGNAPQNKINTHDEYDSLAEVVKLAKEYGLDQLGFFDIEKWKNLSPGEIKMLDAQFKAAAELAKQRNEEK